MNRHSGFSRTVIPSGAQRSRGTPRSDRKVIQRDSSTALGMTALMLFSTASLLLAQDQSATSISREVKECFQRCAKAVVKVHGVDEHSDIYGTGFFVDPT